MVMTVTRQERLKTEEETMRGTVEEKRRYNHKKGEFESISTVASGRHG